MINSIKRAYILNDNQFILKIPNSSDEIKLNVDDINDAHHTSAKYPKEISEFDKTNLEPEFLDGFVAPFVKSSKIKLACKYLNEYSIKENDTINLHIKLYFVILLKFKAKRFKRGHLSTFISKSCN